MLKLELEISSLDYESLLEHFLPLMSDQLRSSGNPLGMLLSNGMSAGMAKRILSTLSQEQIEQLLADLVNGNSKKIIEKAETSAQEHQVNLKIASVHASVK